MSSSWLKATEARSALLDLARQEIAGQSGNNTLVSRTEQKNLSPGLQRAADFARQAGGPGTRITVEDIFESYSSYVDKVLGAVNTKGKKWLSKKEITAIYDQELEGRFWEVRAKLLAPRELAPAELRTRAADFVKANLEPTVGGDTGKPFPNVASGRDGLSSVLLGDDAAVTIATMTNLWPRDDVPVLDFNPNTDAILAVKTSGREESIFVSVVDRKSGEVGAPIELDMSSLHTFISEAEFESLLGPVSDYGTDRYRSYFLDMPKVYDRLLGDGAPLDIGNPYVDFPADAADAIRATADAVLADLGITGAEVDLPPAVIAHMETLPGNSVGFEAALRAAIDSFLTDFDDAESPMALTLEEAIYGPNGGGSWPPNANDIEIARADLLSHINRPSTKVRLLCLGESPEGGESAANNWIVSLYIDSLSDHGHWAVIDRDGSEATYNYGFN